MTNFVTRHSTNTWSGDPRVKSAASAMLTERARLLQLPHFMTDTMSVWWSAAWLAGALVAMVVSIPTF